MAAPGANPSFTLANAMFDCGITDDVLFYRNTKVSRSAAELFDNNFTSYVDKTYVELDDELKSFSTLTTTHVQISLTPGHKKNIKAFIQWTRDHIRLGIDSSALPWRRVHKWGGRPPCPLWLPYAL